jgi:hypothetical protein
VITKQKGNTMNTTTNTYIAEIDGEFANELHQLVTLGTNEERRAWFALELAQSDFDSLALPMESAVYIMNSYVGSTNIRNYDHLVDLLNLGGFLDAGDVTFLKSDFTMSDDVICHCETCNA